MVTTRAAEDLRKGPGRGPEASSASFSMETPCILQRAFSVGFNVCERGTCLKLFLSSAPVPATVEAVI